MQDDDRIDANLCVGGIPFARRLHILSSVGKKRERDDHYFSIFARQQCCRFVHLRILHFLVCRETNAHIQRAHSLLGAFFFFLSFFRRSAEKTYMRMFSA